MIGYFSPATGECLHIYVYSTAPYKMFDKTSLDHLRRGGNADQALNTVMHANHAKNQVGGSMAGISKCCPNRRYFTDDPSNVVSTILTQHIELCESAMNRLSVDGNIQVVYSNGATYKNKSLENYTPYSLLRYGGFCSNMLIQTLIVLMRKSKLVDNFQKVQVLVNMQVTKVLLQN